MKLTEFKFDLPEKLIAKYPTENRDESRLMVINRQTGKIEHKIFKDILGYFKEGDTFIFNNSKVFPARLYGNKEKTGAVIEVFLLRELNAKMKLWDVLVDPARKIRVGNKLYFDQDDSLVAEVIDNTTSRGRTIRFLYDGTSEELKEALFRLGESPVPKQIGRPSEQLDFDRYQTVIAKTEGSVAAPAAGLHFSRELLKRMELRGIQRAEVTLHVGLGSFRLVEVEDLTKHKSESESIVITQEAADKVNKSLENKKQICCVGTTTMKTIESSVSAKRLLSPTEGWTDKYIYPPFDFNIATCMVTNFHLPQSTMLMMAAAFTGYDLLMEAYKEAIKENYRFFVYGDAMLII